MEKVERKNLGNKLGMDIYDIGEFRIGLFPSVVDKEIYQQIIYRQFLQESFRDQKFDNHIRTGFVDVNPHEDILDLIYRDCQAHSRKKAI